MHWWHIHFILNIFVVHFFDHHVYHKTPSQVLIKKWLKTFKNISNALQVASMTSIFFYPCFLINFLPGGLIFHVLSTLKDAGLGRWGCLHTLSAFVIDTPLSLSWTHTSSPGGLHGSLRKIMLNTKLTVKYKF